MKGKILSQEGRKEKEGRKRKEGTKGGKEQQR